MLKSFLLKFNTYALTHPGFLAKLKLLFWVKYWALTVLMAVFVYLIFRERGFSRRPPKASMDAKRGHHQFKA